jgi:hypothetical protein
MRTRQAGLLAIGLAAFGVTGCTLEQILIGQWYTIGTPPAGGCPALQWHFVVDPHRSIGGFLTSDGQQRIATLTGRLNPDDSFQMKATGLAGDRTSDVTGQFTSQVSSISIHGDAAGSACDGKTFNPRLGTYFAFQGGGGGGGGK